MDILWDKETILRICGLKMLESQQILSSVGKLQ